MEADTYEGEGCQNSGCKRKGPRTEDAQPGQGA